MAFSAFSIADALSTLSTSVPDWNRRLEELNGQIALRQIELARLTETERPPTRSLKNKGSTESLRPRDGEQNNDLEFDNTNPFDTPPKSNHNEMQASPTAAPVTSPLPPTRASPIELARKPSVNKPQQTRMGVRKRKTESMTSAESQTPKYRTRSMIIVYYDSAVQNAFEDLVKFVSASRNSMRKGKMNAKMEAMRKAAEKEAENEDDDPEDGLIPKSSDLPKEQPSTAAAAGGKQVHNAAPGTAPAMEIADTDDEEEVDLTKLKFISTRNMGPPRVYGTYGMGGGMASGMLRNARSSAGALEANDIFDDLDKGLEWCQSQCERAAHQFLRDGDCSDEIEGIKKRLLQVKEKAEKEVERIRREEAANPPAPRKEVKSREMRPPQMRKTIGTMRALEINKKLEAAEQRKVQHSKLEADKMEVDEDEGYEDAELPPMMNFRRTRDMGRS